MDFSIIQEMMQSMDELDHPYNHELMTTWEQEFFESMLENLGDPTYRFTQKQVDQIERIRTKYELDIKHGEAIR